MVATIFEELYLDVDKPTVILEDNQSCIKMAKCETETARTKHIDVAYQYVKLMVAKQQLSLQYCSTDTMAADMLTKALSRDKFERFRECIGVQMIP